MRGGRRKRENLIVHKTDHSSCTLGSFLAIIFVCCLGSLINLVTVSLSRCIGLPSFVSCGIILCEAFTVRRSVDFHSLGGSFGINYF